MNFVLEILNALAALASIGGFLLDLWRNHKADKRMKSEEKEKTRGNGSF